MKVSSSSDRITSVGWCGVALLLAVACGQSSKSPYRESDGAGGADDTPLEPHSGGANSAGTSNRAGSAGRESNAGTPSVAGNSGSGEAGRTSGTGGSSGAGGSDTAGSSSVAGAAGQPDLPEPDCEEGVARSSQLRRLSNVHYDRTVRDLLGVTELSNGEPPSNSLAPDETGMPTDLASEAYRAVAQEIAALVVADANLRPKFLVCVLDAADEACWHDTIVAFGRRAFRRPLTEQEVADFELVVATVSAEVEDGSNDEIARVLLEAFLTSPSFLMRAELNAETDAQGNFVLSAHELATRLSYLVWGSLPDPVLDRAADTGALVSKEQLRAQAERMIADDRTREQVASFHRFYLAMRAGMYWTADIGKDPLKFPLYTSDTSRAALDETERFFDAVTFEGSGTFQDFFSSGLGFVNADTAPIYGLDPSAFGPDLTRVELDPSQRPGFLTRVGFLSSFSGYDASSPILRGIFVTSYVLGIELPPPEPNTGNPPPQAEYLTNRDYITALTSPAECKECHETYVNPPGFVLEAYDAIGSWQTQDARGGVIDPAADVFIDGGPVPVRDPAELMQRLANSRDAQRTYAERWVAFANERNLDPADECTVDWLSYRIAQGDYTVLDLLVDLTQTDAFRLRR